MEKSRNVHITIRVYGLVQGVFFRYSAKSEAERLELVGYAKNMPDGSVEIAAEGPRDNLAQLLEWSRRGPAHARVEKIECTWREPKNTFKSFNVL